MHASQALALVEVSAKALHGAFIPSAGHPEETLWLEGQASSQTRRAYRTDVAGFMAFLGITTTDELRLVDRAAVLAWKRDLETTAKPTTIRRKLAALTSLFAHLVERQVLRENPCRDICRPKVNARQGTTPAFAQDQARAILDAPDPATLQGRIEPSSRSASRPGHDVTQWFG